MNSFAPPRRILMGPGPSDVHQDVLAAMACPTIGHLDPAFTAMMDDLKDRLRWLFRTSNPVTFPISGPGSAGMEACFVNLVQPGDQVIVCRNGVFGSRMAECVERLGGTVIALDFPWGEPVDPNQVAAAVKANPEAAILAFVHAETSTGVLSDAATLCSIARGHGLLSVVDVVTSLGGVPVMIDDWGADAAFAGVQKCLSCPPGLAPVTFSPAAMDVVRKRETPVPSWFFDLESIMGYWGGDTGRVYHHTAPVNALYGLHCSLLLLEEEGLEAIWERHAIIHRAMIAGLRAMGLEPVVKEDFRLPTLTTIRVPDGIDEAALRRRLLEEWDLEIGAGLGPFKGKVWRIGLMGQSCSSTHVTLCLSALEETLLDMGAPIKAGVAELARETLFGMT